MYALAYPLLIYYVAVVAIFCLYGVHRYWLVVLFHRSGGLDADPEPAGRFETLPPVTVQLPMYNEARVAERVIRAVCALDYPRDKLQIQVLDDSTDECAEVVRRCCERMRQAGHPVEHHHRTNRAGYKAGALHAGLHTATGELVAMFDADFVPHPDFLMRTVHHFTDPGIGLVQTRWAHLNRDESLLTEIQALCLDGHFIIEQPARARSGRWFNFNGTAGVWRRSCIDDAGGWEHDTLTEDTDISYRAQLRGWTFRYLTGVTCPAELPTTVAALVSQQHRWNKGLMQTAVKLLPTIRRSDVPWRAKLEVMFHLTSPLPYVAMFVLTVLAPLAFAIGLPATGISPSLAVGLGVGCLGLGTLAAGVFYVASQRAQRRSLLATILRLPALMAVGVGISVVNTRAVLEALRGQQSPFVRTPKAGGSAELPGPVDPPAERGRRVPPGAIELGMGIVMLVCIGLAMTQPFTLVGVPFLALFASGYLAIGFPFLRAQLREAASAGAGLLPASSR
jgi:cellulose synthase/poly-beta-1,6-N-acetylglucosamine synthase-like glycosyltransferase